MKVVTIMTCIISLVSLVVVFLALHDIGNDYVSPFMLQHFSIERSLPEWTACPLEWKALKIGFIPIILFHASYLISVMKKKQNG